MKPQWLTICILGFYCLECPISTTAEEHGDSDGHSHYVELYKVYKGCGFIKTCIKICLSTGSGDNGCSTCIKHKSCPAIVTLRQERGEIHVQMLMRQLSLQSVFIATGIAHEKSMLNAPFVACVHRPFKTDNQRIILFTGYTHSDHSHINYFDGNVSSQQLFHDAKLETIPVRNQPRPALYCQFTWKSKFSVKQLPQNNDFSLTENPYFIIASTGNTGHREEVDWALGGHSHNENGRVVTQQAFLLTKPRNNDADYDEDYDCEQHSCRSPPTNMPVALLVLPILTFNFWI